MSFEIRYDRDGNPITNNQLKQQLDQQETPVIEQQELQPVEQETYEQEAQEETVQEAAPQTQPQSQNNDVAVNFRRLREDKERAEKEKDEAIRYAMELRNKYERPQVTEQPQEEEDDISVGQDDLVEGKHLKGINKKYKALKQELNQYKQLSAQQQHQQQLALTEARLKAKYQDFDKVVSADNIERLKTLHPEIAHTLNASTDIYATAVSAYTMIKNLGIHKEDTFVAEKAKAQANSVKPKPMNSVSPRQGDSPLSNANAFANGLTDQLKAQLLKEMRDAAKGM